MTNEKTLRKAQAVLDAHNNTPNGLIRDADTVLEDLLDEREMEVSGTGAEVIEYYLSAKDPDAFCRLFYAIVGCSFEDYLTKCEKALAGYGEYNKTMLFDYGYGAICTNIKWNKDAAQTLASQFKETMKQRFKAGLEDCRCDIPDTTEEEYAPVFLDKYENETLMWSGMLGAICDVINENEFHKQVIFRVDKSTSGAIVLYVSTKIPEDDAERQKILTKQQIRAILTKYLAPLVKSSVPFNNVEIVKCN